MQNNTIFPSTFGNKPTSVASKITVASVAFVVFKAARIFIADVARLVLLLTVGMTLLIIAILATQVPRLMITEYVLHSTDHGKMQQHSRAGSVSESGGARTGSL